MTLRKTTLALLIAATLTPLAATHVYAQSAPVQAPQRIFTQAELDQMLAPVALYPDALLSQVLMAATYPLEVVEAARWTRANPGLSGDAAVRAAENQDWDPSVTSLVAFPQILQRMDEQLQWTQNLGDAFLAQEPSVMDTVQQLRRRAQAAGNLQSNEQIRVVQQGPTILVQSPPQVVYVPYYDPLVVYGPWWHPAYRPVVWAPWPGYVRPRPGVSVGLWFGSPVGVNLNFFFGDFDWGRRQVRVVRPDVHYYRPPRVIVHNHTTVINRNVTIERNTWQHDPHHRRGAAYRSPEVRQRFAAANVERRDEQRETRRDERGLERRAAERPAPAPQVVNRAQAQEQGRQERSAQREERKVQTPTPAPTPAPAPVQQRARIEPQERPQAAPQARPEQRVEPRQEQRVEQRQQQRVEQREQQRAEPRQQERAEPRQRPRAEPREERRAEPRQEQRQEQRSERGGERHGKGGGDRS
jgi:hypothetical protein